MKPLEIEMHFLLLLYTINVTFASLRTPPLDFVSFRMESY